MGGRWPGGWVGGSKALAAVRQLSVEREVLLGHLVDRAAVEELDAKNRALLQVGVHSLCSLACPFPSSNPRCGSGCVLNVSKALFLGGEWVAGWAGVLERVVPPGQLVKWAAVRDVQLCDHLVGINPS